MPSLSQHLWQDKADAICDIGFCSHAVSSQEVQNPGHFCPATEKYVQSANHSCCVANCIGRTAESAHKFINMYQQSTLTVDSWLVKHGSQKALSVDVLPWYPKDWQVPLVPCVPQLLLCMHM